MIVSAGASYRRCAHSAEAGELNRNEPSPTSDITGRDAPTAREAPSAAPPDQPRYPPPWWMTDPGTEGRSPSDAALLPVTTSVSTSASGASEVISRRTHADRCSAV